MTPQDVPFTSHDPPPDRTFATSRIEMALFLMALPTALLAIVIIFAIGYSAPPAPGQPFYHGGTTTESEAP